MLLTNAMLADLQVLFIDTESMDIIEYILYNNG
jgi:hypothetical protein